MKGFTNELVDLIIENEKENLDKIMKEVTEKIRDDFVTMTNSLIDDYYFDYTPIRYVRVYGAKRRLRTKSGATTRKPKAGQVSLHAAINRMGTDENYAISGGSYYDGYLSGIIFDSAYFKDNGMRHTTRTTENEDGTLTSRISEWNIVENFLFAGDKVNGDGEDLRGDIRSHIAYSAPSADEMYQSMMDSYFPRFKQHCKSVSKNFR